jgi:hypothetical protein
VTLFVTDMFFNASLCAKKLSVYTVKLALFSVQTGSNPVPATSFMRVRAFFVTRLCQIFVFPSSKFSAFSAISLRGSGLRVCFPRPGGMEGE